MKIRETKKEIYTKCKRQDNGVAGEGNYNNDEEEDKYDGAERLNAFRAAHNLPTYSAEVYTHIHILQPDTTSLLCSVGDNYLVCHSSSSTTYVR